MRTLFWFLLLGNVILFAVMQQGGLGLGEPPYQPQPPLNADKIRLVPQKNAAPQNGAPQNAAAQNSEQKPPPAAAVASKPASANKQNSRVCLEWGDFSGTDLKRANEFLSALKLGEKLGERQIEYKKGYWVYIPPLKNKAATNRKVAQIKKLGVTEYFIVKDAGQYRNAISLGVFKAREAAQNHLKELLAKKVKGATIGERATKLKTTMFVVNDADSSIQGKLAAAKKDFPGSELKNVPCALTK